MAIIRYTGSGNTILNYIVAMPLTWLMIVPIVIADLFIELYHRVCFPIYGIPYVQRSQYIRAFDREKLAYLTWYEKINCVYCGYANGWLHYASVIAGRTEDRFCAIAHLESRGYIPSEHERSFVKYGDETALRRRYARHEAEFPPVVAPEQPKQV